MKRTTDQYLKSPTNVGKEGKRASDQCLKSLTNVDKVDEKQERAVLKILRSAQNDEKSEVTDQSLKSPDIFYDCCNFVVSLHADFCSEILSCLRKFDGVFNLFYFTFCKRNGYSKNSKTN